MLNRLQTLRPYTLDAIHEATRKKEMVMLSHLATESLENRLKSDAVASDEMAGMAGPETNNIRHVIGWLTNNFRQTYERMPLTSRNDGDNLKTRLMTWHAGIVCQAGPMGWRRRRRWRLQWPSG